MVCCLCGDPSTTLTPGDLDAVARACSPRVAPQGTHAVIFDVDGLFRACGPPEVIAREVAALATAEGLAVRVALAGTMTAAWVLAHARAGTTVVPAGAEAAALASVPLGWLGTVAELDRAGTPDLKVRGSDQAKVRAPKRITSPRSRDGDCDRAAIWPRCRARICTRAWAKRACVCTRRPAARTSCR